jgi:arylsulfatase A
MQHLSTQWAILLGAACAACRAIWASEPGPRPNVILIVADDLGYGDLGCYGQKYIRTPRLDRMAAEGMRFLQFYCGSPVCAPSRCVLLTGKHAGHAAVRDNRAARGRVHDPERDQFSGQTPLPDAEQTLAEVLRAAGYATAAVGKWGLGYEGSSGDPLAQGFELFYGYLCQAHAHNHYPRFLWRNGQRERLAGNHHGLTGETYAQDCFTAEAEAFIRAHRDRPFFLYLPVIIPHLSIQVPQQSLEEYAGQLPEEAYEHTAYLRHPLPRAGYAAMVSHLDRAVGRLLDLLAELKLEDQTLVLFTSDNGPTIGRLGGADADFFGSSGPFRGRKGSLYEGGIRVPLLARWKGQIAAGTTCDLPAAFYDLFPTLCELAGASPPPDLDGLSLLPTLLGRPGQLEHEYLYWEIPSQGGQQAVCWGRYKALRRNMDQANNPDALSMEIFDLHADPGESRDVADEHPRLAVEARRIMREAHCPHPDFPLPPLDR